MSAKYFYVIPPPPSAHGRGALPCWERISVLFSTHMSLKKKKKVLITCLDKDANGTDASITRCLDTGTAPLSLAERGEAATALESWRSTCRRCRHRRGGPPPPQLSPDPPGQAWIPPLYLLFRRVASWSQALSLFCGLLWVTSPPMDGTPPPRLDSTQAGPGFHRSGKSGENRVLFFNFNQGKKHFKSGKENSRLKSLIFWFFLFFQTSYCEDCVS